MYSTVQSTLQCAELVYYFTVLQSTFYAIRISAIQYSTVDYSTVDEVLCGCTVVKSTMIQYSMFKYRPYLVCSRTANNEGNDVLQYGY